MKTVGLYRRSRYRKGKRKRKGGKKKKKTVIALKDIEFHLSV